MSKTVNLDGYVEAEVVLNKPEDTCIPDRVWDEIARNLHVYVKFPESSATASVCVSDEVDNQISEDALGCLYTPSPKVYGGSTVSQTLVMGVSGDDHTITMSGWDTLGIDATSSNTLVSFRPTPENAYDSYAIQTITADEIVLVFRNVTANIEVFPQLIQLPT